MKLKLDLHPIYNDTQKIEASLQQIIDDAITKRATEVEIIPGKGSGALKKTVIRFLDRPDIKAKYHRIEKDGDNWGRLFVHFRHTNRDDNQPAAIKNISIEYICFCCQVNAFVAVDPNDIPFPGIKTVIAECPSCGSPNRLSIRQRRNGTYIVDVESGYE